MPSQGSSGRYGAVAQAFHWLIAALIVTQFVIAISADGLPIGAHKLALLARHKSFGMTVLSSNGIFVVPIVSGVGARLGVNLSYLKFTDHPTWNPF